MDATRRGLLTAVPGALLLSGCSMARGGGGADDEPPYVVENESDRTRTVELTVWNVGQVGPFEERGDSFRDEFESAVEDGSVGESEYEWRETYDLNVEPGSEGIPIASSDATGLLHVVASTDHGQVIRLWIEVSGVDEDFFAEISVYEGGMSATTGEY